MIRWMFRLLLGCAHAWKLVAERDFPSRADELVRLGLVGNVYATEISTLAKKKYVCVLACDKCGGVWTRSFTSD